MLRFTRFSWVKLSFFNLTGIKDLTSSKSVQHINSQTCLGYFVFFKHCQTHTEAKLVKALEDYTQRKLMKSFMKTLNVLSWVCLFGNAQAQVHKASWQVV